jgi:hypothetical protein
MRIGRVEWAGIAQQIARISSWSTKTRPQRHWGRGQSGCRRFSAPISPLRCSRVLWLVDPSG